MSFAEKCRDDYMSGKPFDSAGLEDMLVNPGEVFPQRLAASRAVTNFGHALDDAFDGRGDASLLNDDWLINEYNRQLAILQ